MSKIGHARFVVVSVVASVLAVVAGAGCAAPTEEPTQVSEQSLSAVPITKHARALGVTSWKVDAARGRSMRITAVGLKSGSGAGQSGEVIEATERGATITFRHGRASVTLDAEAREVRPNDLDPDSSKLIGALLEGVIEKARAAKTPGGSVAPQGAGMVNGGAGDVSCYFDWDWFGAPCSSPSPWGGVSADDGWGIGIWGAIGDFFCWDRSTSSYTSTRMQSCTLVVYTAVAGQGGVGTETKYGNQMCDTTVTRSNCVSSERTQCGACQVY